VTIGPGDDWSGLPPAPQPPTPTPSPVARYGRWATIGVGLAALLLGIWFVSSRLPGWLTRPDAGTGLTSPDAPGAAAATRSIQATLYYIAENGTTLVPTSRNVLYGATPVEQARRLVEAQVAPAPAGLVSPIPEGTTVRNVFVTDRREAYVDLGGGIVANHPGGSLNEALTVYAIVNAITTNLPDITAVQILVDGREVDTLRGHIDLRAPLARGTDWIQKGSPAP
jgi:hypothetical protein